MSEFQSTLKKLESNKAVKSAVIIGQNGEVIYPDVTKENQKLIETITQKAFPFVEQARILVKNLDVSNDLSFLHFKSGKEEIMIAPGDNEALIVLSDISKVDS
ncbi:hypothetical protein TVAG_458050 [Trichomonas vaginalis G3]|uniref:Roadblock/LAMTOR2 domain-containing protein n=1 Tax=Trichomonas vaginalis (strain ATCC PRA-98 / G3) TaxID=412133 RepID=A2FKT6_TRIV3|nr:dynein intermediate chain binding [Trichomonas vaginalis G3]EAX94474.1 hypothetical protein TVAG_458050 [Trichomonas vaginalis G3]KAI5504305.1 dynein intermediate chain binding [Trichomonas vaginalis G3]|eukprot:XP_001307404.1 hypothetical protein [Trichomonas vaginalis G3]